jgi:hypothetical protein
MSWMRSLFSRSANVSAGVASGALAFVAVCLWAVGSASAASDGSAPAGQYHVYSCRMPNGEVAPTDGWSGEKSGISASTEDTCAMGGALVAALGDGTTHEVEADRAVLTFSAPAEMTIASAALLRAGDADGGWATNATYEFWLAGPDDDETEADVIDQCVAEFGCPAGAGNASSVKSASNIVTVLPENLGTHLYANVACGGNPKFVCPSGKGDPNGYAAVVYLYAADFVLSQSSQPTVSNVEGELATASTLSGTADLAFHASDSGSGVYQAVFTLDGSEVGRTVLDSSSHCRDVGQTSDGLPAFLYLQPCAPALNADLQFDTTAFSDGTHHLLVSVTNAAGNSTVALDRKIAVLNHPSTSLPPETPSQPQQPSSPGQVPALTDAHEQLSLAAPAPQALGGNAPTTSVGATMQVHWTATAHASLAGAYGRAQTATGRLTSTLGAPLGGATVQVLSTPSFQGAHTRSLMSVRTASDGSFRVRLPASTPSTHLTFAYSAHPGQPVPDVTASLSLTVPARLSLGVTPRVSHIGGTIAFSGVLSGAPLPRGGKQLVLEARALHGPWRQFHVLSTRAHGRFRASYRFRLPGPIDYQFRAVCSREADFPYGTGISHVVRVHER